MEKPQLQIFPVIHHEAEADTLQQVKMCRDAGANGVFVISHRGDDAGALNAAETAMRHMGSPDFMVGVNLLQHSPLDAYNAAHGKVHAVWMDNAGVSSSGAAFHALALLRAVREGDQNRTGPLVFAGVAFKGQAHEPDPCRAAIHAQTLGFMPTTSGEATGVAPDLERIKAMSHTTAGFLSIASGLTPDNIAQFAPLIACALVATGISRDDKIDYELLRVFIANAKAARAS